MERMRNQKRLKTERAKIWGWAITPPKLAYTYALAQTQAYPFTPLPEGLDSKSSTYQTCLYHCF